VENLAEDADDVVSVVSYIMKNYVLGLHPVLPKLVWVNFQKIMTPEANPVNLWHTSFLGGLKGAESKSVVCSAQKCPIRPQN